MKIEVVITVLDNGDFKFRDRLESTNLHSIREEFDLAIEKIEVKLAELDSKKYWINTDDDIPF